MTRPPAPRCTFRGCTAKPTRRIKGEYRGTWLGCPKHAPAMDKAFIIGQRIDYVVTNSPIRAKT